MAKILFGAGIGDARGSIGALTFTRGRFGAVARSKVSPVQPRNASTQTVRGLFGTNSKGWQGLGGGDIVGWNAFAATISLTDKFGNSYHPTGLQLYQMLNRNLQAAGAAGLSLPPSDLAVTGLLTITVTADSDPQTLSVAYTATPADADHHVIIRASNQYSPGRSFIPAGSKQMVATAAAAASPVNILSAYQTRYGLLKAGAKLKVEAFTVNATNGAASTPLVAMVDVA